MNFAIYDKSSGRILQSMVGPLEDVKSRCDISGWGCVEVTSGIAIDQRLHFVKVNVMVDGVPTDAFVTRPANPATIQGLQLSNLPVPCQIIIDGEPYACNEATADLGFTYPATYRVEILAFPFQDKEFRVTV